MTTGTELTTFITGLNADATVDPTLLAVLVQTAQAILEQERPWMRLRKTDSSLSVTTSNAWNTAKSLAGITDFSTFYGETPIRLYDGSNLVQEFYQRPWDRRLEFKDVSGTFVYDAANNTVYINGAVSSNGTLYTSYISTSTQIDPTSASAVWTAFPSRFLPLIGFYAIGVYKGAVDYDSINRQMLPSNQAVMLALKNAMEKWDNDLQMSEVINNDPTEIGAGPRVGAVDRE